MLGLNKRESFTGCGLVLILHHQEKLPGPAWSWVSNQLGRKEPVEHLTSAEWGDGGPEGPGAGGTAPTAHRPCAVTEWLCPGSFFLLSDGINLRSQTTRNTAPCRNAGTMLIDLFARVGLLNLCNTLINFPAFWAFLTAFSAFKAGWEM